MTSNRALFPSCAAIILSTVVHAPALQAQTAQPNLWDVVVEFGLTGASGNSSYSVTRAGFSAKRVKTGRFELDFRTVVRYGRNEEKVIADDAKASIKFDWHPQDMFSPFVFADVARDNLRRLDLQAAGGIGAKWAFLQRPTGDMSLSAAGIFDYQNFALPEGSTEADSEALWRWSIRFKGEKTFGNGAKFTNVVFFQPVVDDINDYVVEVTNSLSTTIVGDLSLAVEHMYMRDSAPPPGTGRDDQRYSVVFRLSL